MNQLPEEAPDKTRFSPDFYTYSSYDELVSGSHDFSTFSTAWMLSNYPIFMTSKEAVAVYDEVVKFDDKIVLSTTDTTRNLTLSSFVKDAVLSDISFSNYDTEKLTIEVDGDVAKIKLVNAITSLSGEHTNLTISYKYNGSDRTINLDVLLMPGLIEVDKSGEAVSALDFAEYIKEDMLTGQVIKSVKQTIDGQSETSIFVDKNGKVSPLNVKVKNDKLGVVNSTVIVETLDLTYKFTNVTAYSHIIKDAEDLKVFEQITDTSSSNVYGYYILANNIDATGLILNHADLEKNNDRYYESKAYFQGVLDGQGYAISNFDARMAGLLRAVKSDTENQAIIKNLAFTNLVYTDDKTDNSQSGFTVFGYQVKGSSNAKVLIQNVHVEIAEVKTSTGFEPSALYKGLVSHSLEMDGVKMENVYINIINEDIPTALGSSEGTIFSTDAGLRGSTQEKRENSGRFTNVVTISELNPSLHANSNQSLAEYWAGYFAYPENMIGEDGKIRVDRKDVASYRYTKVDNNPTVVDGVLQDNVNPTLYYYMSKQAEGDNSAEYSRAFDDNGIRVAGVTDDTELFFYHNSDHPLVTDDPEQHCYIYYGVYKYAEEYDVDADKLKLFTDTGLWELVDKEFTIGEGDDVQTITKQVLEWKSVIPA